MAHIRNRHVLALIKTRLKMSRILTIQGARQTGKSVLARTILSEALKNSRFETFDHALTKRFAADNPDTFLEKNKEFQPLIIDEAQKVPEIFDAVKYQVDQLPAPGQYILLGSTEFSREVKIKESLTGRMSRIRLFPFTMTETLQRPANAECTKAEVFRYLENGGMPGVFALRDKASRETFYEDWISLITSRDIALFSKLKPNPELAEALVRAIPKIEVPDSTHLAKTVGFSPKAVQKHLQILEQLFVVHRVPAHPLGLGKPRYFLLDPGIAGYLGATFERQLQTWLILECLAALSYTDERKAKIYYYRSARSGIIDLVIENDTQTEAIKLLYKEKIDLRDFEILKAFAEKAKVDSKAAVTLKAFGPVLNSSKLGSIQIIPWEQIGHLRARG